ncbi:unnamed protein product, partial [Musa hybrid cultivar]
YLPRSTSHLTSLRALDASLNCLRSLPDGVESLVRLEVLSVSQNFSVLPDSMVCLAELRSLRVEGNPLVRPPMEVCEHSIGALREHLNARRNRSES